MLLDNGIGDFRSSYSTGASEINVLSIKYAVNAIDLNAFIPATLFKSLRWDCL